MKKFSLIVPCHNGDKYIIRCLNSILQQTYKNFEIIFINDSSDDLSEEIIKKYYNVTNIKYYFVEFRDLSKVRNFGLTKVSGDAIVFVDVDDWIEKFLLEKVASMDDNNDLIRYQAVMEDDNKNICESFITSEFSKLNGIEVLDRFATNFEIFSPAWLYAYDINFWTKNNFRYPEDKLQEDFALTSLVLSKANTVSCIPYVGYKYYKSSNSIMRNDNYFNQVKKAYDVLSHCDKFYNDIILAVENEKTKNHLIHYYLDVLSHKLKSLKDKEFDEYSKELELRKGKWK